MTQAVAVTGIGAITALGASAEATWAAVVAGRRGMAPIRRFDTAGCRVAIAAEAGEPEVPPGVRVPLLGASRTARLALHGVGAALTDAGFGARAPAGAALVFGSAGAGDAALERHLERRLRGRAAGAVMARYPKRAATDCVASALGFDGPRATINTACSSSAVAIIHAIELIRAGLCEVAVAGGADELTRYTLTGFSALRAVDPEPCRPFDARRRGMSLGEGAGFVVLESLAAARARGATVRAVSLGYGHTCDASHLTAPDPTGHGAARAIRAALLMAGVAPGALGLVNAHGTGTPHNDRAELQALALALGSELQSCPLHSAKACVGHCMGAAGAVEAIVAILSLRDRLVPYTPGLEQPELVGAADYVMHAPRPLTRPLALSVSFGFGGNDAALIFAPPECVP